MDGQSKELVPVSPMGLLQVAIERGLNPDQLGKLMDLAERYEATQAAKKFATALTNFQAECPVVVKRKTATIQTKTAGTYGYKFASIDDVMAVARPVMARHEIVATFDTELKEGGILQTTCRIRVGSHVESTNVTMPVPDGVMNSAQLMGTALSYAKRYAICAALNIVVTGEDTDAAWVETLTDAEIEQIERLIESKNFDRAKFLSFAKVKDITRIPRAQFRSLHYTLVTTDGRPKPNNKTEAQK